jgi:perosamine synthetase
MKNNKLAIYGGKKIILKKFKRYNSIGKEEIIAANKVLKTGILSDFIAGNNSKFLGGSKVKEFEKYCAKYFKVKYAVTVNSWTSGLVCAVGAIDIEPGDEVIVTPWTMPATATAIIHWNAIPVFADVDKDTFNICPKSIIKNISKKTKAIIAVDIFGQSAEIDKIMKIAKKYRLKVISDSAQAIGTLNKGRFSGTIADVGGFSLNYHKHINTGEGGILVTNNKKIYNKLTLIRNHGEMSVNSKNKKTLANTFGHNFRLGEIESAIGIEQLKKLNFFINKRRLIADKLSNGISDLLGLQTPKVLDGYTHSYYKYPIILSGRAIKKRSLIKKALESEGIQGLSDGYICTHLLPMYQQKIAYGSKGFPWNSEVYKKNISYKKGICPVAENLHFKSYLGLSLDLYDLNLKDINLIIKSFRKVWKQFF